MFLYFLRFSCCKYNLIYNSIDAKEKYLFISDIQCIKKIIYLLIVVENLLNENLNLLHIETF